ncbi:MFS transporter [Solicola gregarius]|uniref:MFS transporter n=1 Tax=Solicola gregarius TaxID=2908642 RepID=A0AA46TG41_9ACTN|nr:MFS transporter [Solicola gregarius]UYM04505.1 MFS transporter [Solicola gregarius]
MSRTTDAASYRAVLALPYALPTFAAALVGRLAYGLLPLSVIFTVQTATGSFATAGSVVAAFGAASLSMPSKARIVDRRGQAGVLPPLAGACAAALITIAALARSDVGSPIAYVCLGLVAGLAAPPLGPSMRATWRRLTDGTTLKERAYSLDSVCEESLYLVGPMIVGLTLAIAPAEVALVTTGALLVIGTLGMVLAPPARRRAVAASVRRARFGAGPLRARGFGPVLATILVTAAALSIAYTCIAARAQEHGTPAAAGYIEAAIACGSVAGGLAWGRRRHSRSRATQLVGLVAYLAAGVSIASTAAGLLPLGAVMAVTGVAIAPLFVVAYVASDELAPPDQRTEASTWVNTANNIGSALGASTAGVLIDAVSPAAGFASAGALLAATAVAVRLAGRR